MFLLFRVGLEVKASQWKQVGWTGTLVILGRAAPFVAHWGWAISFRLGTCWQRLSRQEAVIQTLLR
jgi:Kef-type K+ transport system membrane component KefB